MRKAALLLILGLLLGETREEILLRIRLLEREISSLEKKGKSLAARLERISAEINLVKARMALERNKLREIDREMKEGKEKIRELQTKLKNLREEVRSLALFLYKHRWAKTTLLMELFYFRDPTYPLYFYRKIARSYIRARRLLEEKRRREEELRKIYPEKIRLLRSLRKRELRLKRIRARLQREIAFIVKNRERKRKLLSEIKSPEFVPGQSRASAAVKPGEMLWPIRGRVVRRFGSIIHPVFHTRINSTGIEIQPAKEEEYVRAVAPGVVEFVSRFSGYGRVVIISHGGRLYTVYGHLLDVFVEKGQRVKAGQKLGSLGEGAFWKGKTLYFEVRVGGEPRNPLRWLRKR